MAAALYTYSCAATFNRLRAGQYLMFWWAIGNNGLIAKTTPFGSLTVQKPQVTVPDGS